MAYKISGSINEDARIIVIKESDWSIEYSSVISGTGAYEIVINDGDERLVACVKDTGHCQGYGAVIPIYYADGTSIFDNNFWYSGRGTWNSGDEEWNSTELGGRGDESSILTLYTTGGEEGTFTTKFDNTFWNPIQSCTWNGSVYISAALTYEPFNHMMNLSATGGWNIGYSPRRVRITHNSPSPVFVNTEPTEASIGNDVLSNQDIRLLPGQNITQLYATESNSSEFQISNIQFSSSSGWPDAYRPSKVRITHTGSNLTMNCYDQYENRIVGVDVACASGEWVDLDFVDNDDIHQLSFSVAGAGTAFSVSNIEFI